MFETFATFIIEWAEIVAATVVVAGTIVAAVKVVRYFKS
jgi:hypothetical protein